MAATCGLVFVAFCIAVARAQEGTWAIIDSDIATIDTGVAFQSETVGYTAGVTQNGPEIFKTIDGGVTFNPCTVTSFGPDLLLLSAAASGNSVLISSIFGELYSTDNGTTFQRSTGGGVSQCVRHFGAGKDGVKFGTAGQFSVGRFNGVGISQDGGKTIQTHNVKQLFTEARYAAFPTDTTWYVTAGAWPPNANEANRPKTRQVRPRRSQMQNPDGTWPKTFVPPTPNDAGYSAQIAMTQDAGKTWTTVFAQNGTFYFNGIDCNPSNALNCCACAEGFGSSGAGARIFCTQDGGKTWNNTFYQAQTSSSKGYSLMDIRFTTAMDAWAVGGELTGSYSNGWFLHSVDGGNTWTYHQKPIPGTMVLALDMVDTTCGYAAVDNTITQASSIAKYKV